VTEATIRLLLLNDAEVDGKYDISSGVKASVRVRWHEKLERAAVTLNAWKSE